MAAELNGQLRRAAIVAGPLGKTCQIHFVTPEAVAIITELNFMAGSMPTETWLMTCNHGDGDVAAERVCRGTLAGFKAK